MFNFLKRHIKYILLIILLIILTVIYLQSQEINNLKRMNNELKDKTDDAFVYIFSISSKSVKFAESLEYLSYIKADAHYDEYKYLFKRAYEDLDEWKAEFRQLISLGMDNDISNNTNRYYSSDINNVIMRYRFNNISPADFSEEWKVTLRDTAKLLRSLDKEMNSIKNSDIFYMHEYKTDVLKTRVIKVLEEHLDNIYRINNIEVERLRNQINELLKEN